MQITKNELRSIIQSAKPSLFQQPSLDVVFTEVCSRLHIDPEIHGCVREVVAEHIRQYSKDQKKARSKSRSAVSDDEIVFDGAHYATVTDDTPMHDPEDQIIQERQFGQESETPI